MWTCRSHHSSHEQASISPRCSSGAGLDLALWGRVPSHRPAVSSVASASLATCAARSTRRTAVADSCSSSQANPASARRGWRRRSRREADRARDVRAVWGRCWEGGGAPAYWPWIQVVRACLADADAEQRTAILGFEATPQIAQYIAQLLPELHAAHPQNVKHPGPQPSDPEQARFQLFEAVATVLKNVARIAPIVIVIDDLHDADHPSLLMQKFIASQTKDARILMVGTYRDTEVRQSQELSKLIGDLTREGHSIPIAGLSQTEVGEFVESSSGKKADDKLVADLYQATDGNPLFVDGVVRLLVAEGKVDRARLEWQCVQDSRWRAGIDSAAAGKATKRNEPDAVDGIGNRQRIRNALAGTCVWQHGIKDYRADGGRDPGGDRDRRRDWRQALSILARIDSRSALRRPRDQPADRFT